MSRKRTPAQNQVEPEILEELKVEFAAEEKEPEIAEVVEEPAVEVEVEAPKTYKVHVTHPSLRKRAMPNLGAYVAGIISDQGIYEIFETVNGWGRLEDGNWIMLSYTEIV